MTDSDNIVKPEDKGTQNLPGLLEANRGDNTRARVDEFRKRHRTSLVTLLFTDLAGSTKLKQERGDREGVALMQAHASLVREILRTVQEAQEISTAGDSFFCVFIRPSDAVAFGLRVQAAMRKEFVAAGLKIRIGIHLGEVIVEERDDAKKPLDLFGIQVDTAARVMSLADGGQLLVTRPVFDNARPALKGRDIAGLAPLVWMNHGPYIVKGVEDPVEICEVGEEGLGVLKAPGPSEKARPADVSEEELGWRPSADAKLPGTDWVIEDKLGQGGFGEVWLASHKRTKEKRVFKFCFLRDKLRSLRRELVLFRLIREKIGEHPNIVRLYEVFLEEPPFYLGIEYVAGRNLREWLMGSSSVPAVPAPPVGVDSPRPSRMIRIPRLKTLSTRAKLDIIAQIADALDAAHRAGVIHQDVKPQNILVDEAAAPLPSGAPKVKLADFGVGRVKDEEVLGKIQMTGGAMTLLKTTGSLSETGTFMYMAPERVEGKGASPQSDIYSLGVVLFQMIAGDVDRALTADWESEVADPVLKADLRKMLGGRPENRLATAALAAERMRTWNNRRRTRTAKLAGAVAFAVVLLVAAVVFVFTKKLEATRVEKEKAEGRTKIEADLKNKALAAEKAATKERNRAEDALKAANENLSDAYMFKGLAALDQNKPLDAMVYLAAARDRAETMRTICAAFAVPAPAMTLDRTFTGEHDTVLAGAISHDGRLVAGAQGNFVKVWNAATGKLVWELAGHTDDVRCVAFSPVTGLLASCGNDKTLRLWDTTKGQAVHVLTDHKNYLYALAFSPDGTKVASGGGDDTVIVWDSAAGKKIASNPIKDSEVCGLAFSPDSRKLAIGTHAGTISLWGMDGNPARTITETNTPVAAIAFSPDGTTLAAAGKEISLLDARTGQQIRLLKGHEKFVLSVAFSPDGAMLVAGDVDSNLILYDTGTFKERCAATCHGAPFSVEFSSDGRRILTAGGAVRTWNVSTLDASVLETGQRLVTCVAFSPDGRIIATGGAENRNLVKLWNVADGKELSTLAGHEGCVQTLAFSPDGAMLASGGQDGLVKLWDSKTGRLLGTLPGRDSWIQCVAFSPDSTMFAAAAGDEAVLYDTRTQKELHKLTGHQKVIQLMSLAFSPDGRTVATASKDTTLKLWDANTGKEIRTFAGHAKEVSSVAFTPDGRHVISGSWDGTVKMWDVATGALTRTFNGSQVYVFTLAISPDARIVATGGPDGRVRLWSIASGEEIMALSGNQLTVPSVAFSPDGRTIASVGGASGSVKIWGGTLTDTMAEAERLSGSAIKGFGQGQLAAEREKELLAKYPNPPALPAPPDQVLADYWRALWRTRRAVAELKSNDAPAVEAALAPLTEWLKANPKHSKAGETRREIAEIR
jgi:WD40 repeat protein/serine/threonine protein kinase/class 3 adenylate cyclase